MSSRTTAKQNQALGSQLVSCHAHEGCAAHRPPKWPELHPHDNKTSTNICLFVIQGMITIFPFTNIPM